MDSHRLDSRAQDAETGQAETPDWLDPAARAEGPLTSLVELRRFDGLLGLSVVLLTVLSLATLVPGPRFEVESSGLGLVLNTLTAVATAGAAALAWIRYRIERETSAIFESSAFLVLFATRALVIMIEVTGRGSAIGLSIDAPQQWPIYGWTAARLVAAVLLMFAAVATLSRSKRAPFSVGLLELGPAVAVLLFIGLIPNVERFLPPLLGPDGLAAMRGDSSIYPGMEPPGLVLQAIVALFYLRGAQLYREIFRERGRRYAGYLSIALIVASFSQLHWAIVPGIYQPIVTVDEILRAGFAVILLLGIDAQSRADVRALRLANARLHALRSADAERAALEASARLAREVHDGLSQDLWLAKLKQSRLAQMTHLPEDARSLNNELGDAVDRALGGARAVLATMRTGSDGPTVGESLSRVVEDFGARFGIRAEFTTRGNVPALPSRTAAELIRIVQEALTNVQKHADATVVRVNADWGRSAFELSVADNGRGFDPTALEGSTFGIRGMRERAELIGGEIEIVSRDRDGTRVFVRVPGRDAAAKEDGSPAGARRARRNRARPAERIQGSRG